MAFFLLWVLPLSHNNHKMGHCEYKNITDKWKYGHPDIIILLHNEEVIKSKKRIF